MNLKIQVRITTGLMALRIYLDTINCPGCFEGLPTIRAGGKEICWMGDRGDSYGDKDIYCAKRR